MNGATKVGAYVLGLAAVFGGAFGVGKLAGPVGETGGAPAGHVAAGASGGAGHAGDAHAGAEKQDGSTGTAGAAGLPGGLQVSAGGYTLVPRTDVVEPGEKTDFRFSVTGPDGRPVTRFTPQHEKELHFIVVRRDLTGFQHLHPVREADGTWSVPLTLPEPGEYRAFADFAPEGAEGMTLGTDLSAPGDYRPEPLGEPVRTATVDGYTVTLAGDLVPGRSSGLTLSVSRDGEPVTDLEPYLGAYGHLVALRDGDLAYLHVHPGGEPGDGRTAAGPGITFHAEVPSAGAYRLFLDFKHGGEVRTAEFTAVTAGTPAPAGDDGDRSGGGPGADRSGDGGGDGGGAKEGEAKDGGKGRGGDEGGNATPSPEAPHGADGHGH
ncbi:heavy metal-associated domain-containing secreted protein [Planomonospora sphaerica]|uniref:Heavy metal-associated domain-containing secreted protein n=1 Tax=Planomonospora sphaerica TaxID=161355 RepID=A0A171C7D7_9ACTN|nr:hypothetical protein [Planomonospora sphaerica]GAT66229.1 heavy metal-associated domain-containing secreted protein [Planomonospora sphaerica]